MLREGTCVTVRVCQCDVQMRSCVELLFEVMCVVWMNFEIYNLSYKKFLLHSACVLFWSSVNENRWCCAQKNYCKRKCRVTLCPDELSVETKFTQILLNWNPLNYCYQVQNILGESLCWHVVLYYIQLRVNCNCQISYFWILRNFDSSQFLHYVVRRNLRWRFSSEI